MADREKSMREWVISPAQRNAMREAFRQPDLPVILSPWGHMVCLPGGGFVPIDVDDVVTCVLPEQVPDVEPA